ncbi:MAG TPA: adenylate/guanylate cyclase domain-containing protein [Nocardioidaceae bacterium]|nr:adenylate/guanylate cyclase domain-containing protein [Nocardioidaceae bacterium]
MRSEALPSGTVTFLFTDVAGSTALWEESPDTMSPAMARHDEIIDSEVVECGGSVVRPRGEGDSRFAVFGRAADALAAALGIQTRLLSEPWKTPRPIRVRLAVHTGETEFREGDYYGTAVNRCARLRGIAHPGQILLTGATMQLVSEGLPEGASARDLGRHRLRDIVELEHVYQLCHDALPADFPPVASLDNVPHNLPLHLSPLIGRDTEVPNVAGLLASQRLVTITGTGGTGKTRLALAVASELLRRFPDGVWLAELAALSNPDLVGTTVAATMNVHEASGEPIARTLAAYLGTKSVLLVIDNCEHVVGAVAELVDSILRATPNVRVLATSQEPLLIAGEATIALQPLQRPDAVQLFETCARAANPSFIVDASNREAIEAISERLDGVPLAMQLAAARTRLLTPAQILERLADRFRLLSTGERTGPDRHRTLMAAVEWSHDLLSPSERVLYRRLGVFHGGATLEGIERVCADGDLDVVEILDLLQRLVDRSLVTLDSEGLAPRYRMLETIRAHASDKLSAADESIPVSDGHLAWCRDHAENGYHGARGSESSFWTQSMRVEIDNFRAALTWGLDGGDLLVGQRTCTFLRRLWIGEGFGREGIHWAEAFLAKTPDEPSSGRIDALVGLGDLRAVFGGDAIAPLDTALDMAREVGDPGAEGTVEYFLATTLSDLSGPTVAIPHFEAARALLPPGDPLLGILDVNLGITYLDLGRFDRAIEHTRALLAELDQPYHAAFLRATLGLALAEAGELDEGAAECAAAIETARSVGERYLLTTVLQFGAEALSKRPEHRQRAADALEEALSLHEGAADPLTLFDLIRNAGQVAEAYGDFAAATIFTSGAARLATASNLQVAPRQQHDIDSRLARARVELGDGFDEVLAECGPKPTERLFSEVYEKVATWASSTPPAASPPRA